MSNKFQYILTILILILLALTISACNPFPPQILTPPQPTNSTQHINPSWTFSSDSSPTATTLPDFPPVIAKVMPSVVSVTTETIISSFFGQFTQLSAGSGVLIDEEGYIVTNNHVVQNAKNIQVELADKRTFPADVVGTDSLTDLAVIKIDATDLYHVQWGNSSSLSVGNWVIAIGNALGEGITATEGIVSRLNVSVNVEGNTLSDLIQTTTAINPGNSGGPLVNMLGEVIGLTSVKMAAIDVEGIGYAISSNGAKPVIEDIIRQGYVTRPWLGVALSTVDPLIATAQNLSVEEGALIVEVVANSPAASAGLKKGDVIIRFGGKEITDLNDLIQSIRNSQIGQEVEITFVRGEDTETTSVTLIESPPPSTSLP